MKMQRPWKKRLAMTDFGMDKPTLSQALNGFTSEFGMGSGGTHLLQSPGRNCLYIILFMQSDCKKAFPLFIYSFHLSSCLHITPKQLGCYMVKSHGQLVLVSYSYYYDSTPSLSTLWSTTDLQSLSTVRSYLEASFPLRCFQRLSLPYLATQPCHWRDNWGTRGTFTPVLSYQEQLLSNLKRPRQIGTELSHDVLNPARVPL